MLALMQCVGEAVMSKGVRGLVGMVPGGAFLYDVAADAMKRMKDRKQARQLREEVLQATVGQAPERHPTPINSPRTSRSRSTSRPSAVPWLRSISR